MSINSSGEDVRGGEELSSSALHSSWQLRRGRGMEAKRSNGHSHSLASSNGSTNQYHHSYQQHQHNDDDDDDGDDDDDDEEEEVLVTVKKGKRKGVRSEVTDRTPLLAHADESDAHGTSGYNGSSSSSGYASSLLAAGGGGVALQQGKGKEKKKKKKEKMIGEEGAAVGEEVEDEAGEMSRSASRVRDRAPSSVWALKLRLLHDVAKGMAFIHRLGHAHR